MLVLSRKKNEAIMIGEVEVIVVEIRGDKCRLGIEADRHVPVHRKEVYDAIKRNYIENRSLAKPVILEDEKFPVFWQCNTCGCGIRSEMIERHTMDEGHTSFCRLHRSDSPPADSPTAPADSPPADSPPADSPPAPA